MASWTDFGNDLYTGKRSINFVGGGRIWFSIAAVLILLSVAVPFLRGGFNLGIEFTGGSEFRVSQPAQLDTQLAADTVTGLYPDANPVVTVVGGDSLRVTTTALTDDQVVEVRNALDAALDPRDVASSYVGPSWGQDVSLQALRALLVFLVLVAIGMALYFRTWKMALAALVALLHDLMLTAGIYGAVGFEVTPAAVIGLLTILGYSLYDTVVVFDKVRENTSALTNPTSSEFANAVNLAVNQTLVRSINTSIVGVLPIASILFIGTALIGAGTLQDIALALFVGVLAGTYSSVFIAAPLYARLRQGEPQFRRTEAIATA